MNSSIAKTVSHPFDLPEDLVILILERSHVKPLLRFKGVSKSWCNMISSPAFVKSHSQKQRNVLLVMRRLRSLRRELVFSFHDLDSPEFNKVLPDSPIPIPVEGNFVIIGQCDGIVFLAYNLDVILCNPALRVFKFLLRCPFASDDHKYVCTRWGLGNTTNGFTVVQLQHHTRSRSGHVYSVVNAYLFDSATNSWREIDRTYTVPTNLHVQSDIFFNGACHWPLSYPVWGQYPNHILTMDVSNGVFGALECPDWSRERVKESRLKVLDDCLAMVLFLEYRNARVIEVWVMKEYGVKESWTKQFIVGPYRVVTPLLFLKDDRMLMEDIHNELASCQLRKREIKIHGVTGIRNSFDALIYKESLFSLN